MALDFAGTVTQAGKFGVVGVINTVVDFSIFNGLTIGGRVPDVVANICSTTIAMVFSFIANRDAVFRGGSGSPFEQALLFFAVTAIGVYILQTGVLYLIADRWKWPKRWLVMNLQKRKWASRLSRDILLRNIGKICGTAVSLIWNFMWYKYVVFH